MICPTCNGKGHNFGHCNTGPDSSQHYWGDLKCFRCKGSGEVPDEMKQWIADGKAMVKARRDNGLTLIEAAKTLGISSAELSAMENGHKPFTGKAGAA